MQHFYRGAKQILLESMQTRFSLRQDKSKCKPKTKEMAQPLLGRKPTNQPFPFLFKKTALAEETCFSLMSRLLWALHLPFRFMTLSQLTPDDEGSYFNWGLCLCVRASQKTGSEALRLYDSACGKYERAVRLNSQSKISWFNYGLAVLSRARCMENDPSTSKQKKKSQTEP